jgi:hypothetical protein
LTKNSLCVCAGEHGADLACTPDCDELDLGPKYSRADTLVVRPKSRAVKIKTILDTLIVFDLIFIRN